MKLPKTFSLASALLGGLSSVILNSKTTWPRADTSLKFCPLKLLSLQFLSAHFWLPEPPFHSPSHLSTLHSNPHPSPLPTLSLFANLKRQKSQGSGLPSCVVLTLHPLPKTGQATRSGREMLMGVGPGTQRARRLGGRVWVAVAGGGDLLS